jgi:hypothetical protein
MRRRLLLCRFAVLAPLTLAAACSELDSPSGPSAAEPPEPAFAVQAGDRGDEMSALARTVPGFGGLYLDDDGVPTLWLRNPAGRATAEPAVRAFLRARDIDAASLNVRQATHDWQQLERWFDRANDEVFALPGAVFVDIDEAANRLTIGVDGPAAAGQARAALARAGLPDDGYAVVETEPIYQVATLRDAVSPRVGGLQIHFGNYLCTLGFNARDGTQDSFITNSHCTNKQGGVESTVYYQPLSSVSPTSIGTEVEDPKYQRNIAGCPRGRVCRRSDSARVRYNSGVAFDLGGIALTALGSLTISGTYNITAEGTATVGQTVNKVGRTTGRTQGNVSNTCVNTGVSGTNIVQLCQTFVNAGVGGGDSGSNVFRITSSPSVTLVGILWGGNSSGTMFVFSPIGNIEQELGALTTF